MYERFSKKYGIAEVLKQVPDKFMDDGSFPRYEFDGHLMKFASLRLVTFKVKGTICISCGIEGKFFVKERPRTKNPQNSENHFHFNLYAINGNGKEVLMTKDHILPKSKGGKDKLHNLQTMCYPCNKRKGNNT